MVVEELSQAQRGKTDDESETDEEIRRRGILAALRAWELRDPPKGEPLRRRSRARRK